MPPRATAHDLPIDGFDASRWHALDGVRMEQPWQSLPDHVRRSSAGRPWQGLAVWHQVGPLGDLYVPPQGNHAILLRNGPPTRLLQRHGNQVGQAHWQRGDAVVLPTDTPSFWRSTTARDNIHIDLSPAWLQRAAGTDVVLGNCFGRSDPVLAAFAELLLASLDNGASLNPAFGEHIAMGIAIHLVERYAQPHGLPRAQGSLSMRQMRQLTEAVQGSLHERWPVARLAALAALSPFHFARAFKASFGTTPHAWVQLQRMELAARLVRGSRQPLEEIAVQTGHPSAAHFSHAFRRHWGMTPSAYRRTG
ncbi:helix-turn-helix domain-containing protein [Pseudorhodoferax sp. Leaf274]|uniref:helix-turn-helix domain-containing protein n=1 Tax=Pseudorhodoferax sp. Leaf274 TaxID=1736318 RepID=UPI00070366DE|nr:AraC family transcriptional regulator [Pseudorhodoferax sp. Leaf274]KQP49791.1 AraC family transcriptional regulator [Pseudorhodoferax sp. Leaf274]